jgi:hypothetical protein
MSDLLRTDGQRAFAAPDADHDAKIEQLLLAGLDHYFAAQYESAINVWSRVLFLDRSHARARAYIDRARSALAERQRESEELLQRGLAALQRGDSGEARRLVQAAIDGGAPSHEAESLLDRLDRLGAAPAADSPPHGRRSYAVAFATPPKGHRPFLSSALTAAGLSLAVLAAAGVYSGAVWDVLGASAAVRLQTSPPSALPSASRQAPPLPRRGELALERARSLATGGHLRDALATLDLVRLTDPEKPEADRLRAEIQLLLIALAPVAPPVSAGARERAPGARSGQ